MKTRKFKMFNVLYLVCFALFLSLTASFFATSYTSTLSWDAYAEEMTYNSSTGVYEIYTAEQFAGFSASVNSGTTYAGKTIRVMNNIDLKNKAVTPVGVYSYKFQGTFDGQNSAFSNVNIDYSGLFKYVENATVQNVVIDSGTIYSYSSIAEYSINSKILNCTNRAKFSTSTLAGGIVDDASNGSLISNCMNYGSIANSNNAGGIVRVLRYSTVENCVNYGTVVSTGSGTAVGGIVGTADNATIKNCSNFGTVGSGTYYSSSSAYAGGIVGSATSSTISNCYNNSSVRAETETTQFIGLYKNEGYAGGIVGNAKSVTISNCFAEGSVYSMSASFDYSILAGTNGVYDMSAYNSGITYYFAFENVKWYHAGGIVGCHNSNNTVSNCGYSATITKSPVQSYVIYNKGSSASFTNYDHIFVFRDDGARRYYPYYGGHAHESYDSWRGVDWLYNSESVTTGGGGGGNLYKDVFKGIRLKTGVVSSGSLNSNGNSSNIKPMWYIGSSIDYLSVFYIYDHYRRDWIWNDWSYQNRSYSTDGSTNDIPIGESFYFESLPGTYSTSPLDYLGSDWVQHDYAGYVYNKIYW